MNCVQKKTQISYSYVNYYRPILLSDKCFTLNLYLDEYKTQERIAPK